MFPIFKKTIFWGSLFVFLVSLIVYFLTLAPSIPPGDGAELITAAYTWGTAHPPGYPLLTLLSKIFITIFPFGNIAWRVNLLNALFGSFTAVVIYFIIYKVLRGEVGIKGSESGENEKKSFLVSNSLFIIPAIVGSLFLAFSSAFWYYSITAEVFALHHLFVALLILIILTWREKFLESKNIPDSKPHRWLYLFCFVAGLSFTNQQAIVFLAPAFLFLILVTDKKIFFNPRTLPLMFFFLALGLTPYFYLLIAASLSSGFHWSNPSNLRNFFGVIVREGYGGLPYPKTDFSLIETWQNSLWFYLKSLYFHFTIVGFSLGILGLFSLVRRKKIFFFFLLSFLFTGPLFLFYLGDLKLEDNILRAVAERVIIFSEISISIFIGYGTYYLIKKIIIALKTQKIKFLVYVPFLFSFLIPLLTHYSFVDQSKNSIFYDFGYDILSYVDKDGLIISKGDMLLFSFLYLQNVEKIRQDVKVVHRSLLEAEWYIRYLKKQYPDIIIPFEKLEEKDDKMAKIKEIVDANISQRSIYYPVIEDSQSFKPKYFVLQRDFLFQVIKGKPSFEPKEYLEQNENFYKNSKLIKNPLFYQIKLNKKYPFFGWEYEILANYATSHTNKCSLLYELKDYQNAEKECLMVNSAMPDFTAAYFNLGKVKTKEKDYQGAIAVYEKVIQIDPVNLAAYQEIMSICSKYLNDEEKAKEYLERYKESRAKQ